MALTDGLVEWWDLSSNTGQHASKVLTNNGSPSFAADGVTLVNADADFLTIANASAGDFQMGTGDRAFAGWFFVPSSPGYPGSFMAVFTFGGTASGAPGYHVAIRNTGDFWIFLSDGTGRLSHDCPGTPVSLDTLHFMYAHWDRDGNMLVDIDDANEGTENISSMSGSDIQATADFFIGGGYVEDAEANPYRSFGFWSRTLTGAERTQLYNSGTPLKYSDFGGGGSSSIISPQSLSLHNTYRY